MQHKSFRSVFNTTGNLKTESEFQVYAIIIKVLF